MKHLKRFNELNIAGTYLDKTNIPKSDTYSISGIKKITSDLLSKKGKIFKDEPTTASSPILKFELAAKGKETNEAKTSYRVIFPSNFLDQDKDPNMKKLLENIFILSDGEFNRTHFTTFMWDKNLPASDGVPIELRGIGLGYVIYENFIKYLGFASSSNSHTTAESMGIWNKIATDPDFLCILLKEDKNRGEIIAIHKGFADTEKIAFEFIENLSPNTKEILIDDELMKLPKVAELKTKFDSLERDSDGFVKTIKNLKTFVHYGPFRIGDN